MKGVVAGATVFDHERRTLTAGILLAVTLFAVEGMGVAVWLVPVGWITSGTGIGLAYSADGLVCRCSRRHSPDRRGAPS